MPIATGLALGLAGISAAGSIGGAAIASSGASKAAGAQTDAANYAANLQHQDAQAALDFQKQQLGIQQQNIAPWLQTGQGALSQLSNLLGVTPAGFYAGSNVIPNSPASNLTNPQAPTLNGNPASKTLNLMRGGDGSYSMPLSQLRTGGPRQVGNFGATLTNPLRGGNENGIVPTGPGQNIAPGTSVTPNGPGTSGFGSLMQGYDKQFVAPTAATEQNDPGYKFRLDQGMQALQNSAAARGGLLSGNTAKAITDYAQNYASNEYGNVYNRALGEYQQGYNIFQNDQSNKFNRLSALSGTGQTAASQLNSASQGAAGNVSNILLGSGQQIGQDVQNAGAATASGYAAGANAFGGAVSGIGNNLTNLLLLSQLKGAH